MALSFLGINRTPANVLDAGDGITFFGRNIGPASYITGSSFDQAMDDYLMGDGRYSPPIIHLPGYSKDGHFVLVIDVVRPGQYTVLDPARADQWTITVNGSSASYNGKRDRIDSVRQYSVPEPPAPAPQHQALVCFHSEYYMAAYGDLERTFGLDPGRLLSHWRQYGQKEGRAASPVFDPVWYLRTYPDVANAVGADGHKGALDHFVTYGLREGRSGSFFFSPTFYLEMYPDLRDAFGDDYCRAAQHFIEYGVSEGRQASDRFAVAAYRAHNPDVDEAFSSNFRVMAHYTARVLYGPERRVCA